MAADDELDMDAVEMTNLERPEEDEEEGILGTNKVPLDDPAPRNSRCVRAAFFFFALAAALLASVLVNPSFIVDMAGSSGSSGEVGIDADNAKTQEFINVEVEEELGIGGKGNGILTRPKWPNGKILVNTHQPGEEKDWIRNFTYWRDHPDIAPPSIDKEKLEKLRQFYNRTSSLGKRPKDLSKNYTKHHFGNHAESKAQDKPGATERPTPGSPGSIERPTSGLTTMPAPGLTSGPTLGSPGPTEQQRPALALVPLSETLEPTSGPTPGSPDFTITLNDGKKFEVLAQLLHDTSSFTQGLTYAHGMLYESTGLYGKSKIRQLNPDTGEVIKSIDMEKQYFGEGLTYYDDGNSPGGKLIQITWKSQAGFIYEASNLDMIEEFKFTTTRNEGWGITFDPGNRIFIVSDGSQYLHFWDADHPGKDKKKKVEVIRQNGQAAKKLNELEFVNGKVLANVWYTDILLVIDPETGVCEMEYDFSMLWPKASRPSGTDVLNGISVSGEGDILYMTGKLWDKIYKIRLDGEIATT